MLFKVTEYNDLFKDNPELNSIKEFSNCTSRQLKYIFYTYDYKSPLRQLPLEKRKDKAARMAGYKNEKGKTILDKNGRNIVAGNVSSVNAATRAFLDLQYDADKEMLLSLDEQISQIVDFARRKDKDAKELELSVKISKNLPALAKLKKELVEILDMRDEITAQEEDDTVADDQLSTLDLLNKENE